jgi:hypothetical protein
MKSHTKNERGTYIDEFIKSFTFLAQFCNGFQGRRNSLDIWDIVLFDFWKLRVTKFESLLSSNTQPQKQKREREKKREKKWREREREERMRMS